MVDLSINLGNLLTAVAMIAAGVGFVVTQKYEGKMTRQQLKAASEDVKEVQGQVRTLEDEMKKLVEILVQQGRQEERLLAMDGRLLAQGARVDDLSRQVLSLFQPKVNP